MELKLSPLRKALDSLDRALQRPKDEFIRDSVIQRFEFSYELAWKLIKRYFVLNQGLDESNVQALWREAGRQKLIPSVENFFKYHRARNLSSHTYDEMTSEEVYLAAKEFAVEGRALLERLEGLLPAEGT